MVSLQMFLIIISLMICLLSHGIQSYLTLVDHQCQNTTLSETYKVTSKELLEALDEYSYFNDKSFFNTFVTNDSTTVYGSYLCRGDLTPRVCSYCVYSAKHYLINYCSDSKEGYIWYDECSLRYSNTTISYREEPYVYMYNTRQVIKESQQKKLKEFIVTTMAGEMASKAATQPILGKKFVTKEMKLSSFQMVYSLVQCTPDLTYEQCFGCIHTATSKFNSARGARMFRPSCNVRYEMFPFYQINDEKVLQLVLAIECGVVITTIMVFWLFVLGCLRRRIHDTWQGVCIVLIYTLITIGIPYLIGLMRSVDFPFKLFPIWAFFLIFAYGGSDTMTAYSLNDNERSLGYYFRMMPLLFGANFLIGPSFTEIETYVNLLPLITVYILAIWNVLETMAAFSNASKSNGLPKLAARTDKYMRRVEDTMDSYLVDAANTFDIVTTEQVCKSTLLSIGGERWDRLKDICLSHAYFNILLMRCAGYSLHDKSRDMSQRFFRVSLLPLGEERIFRIIEVELEFLFDFFYTKFFFLNKRRFAYKFIRVAGIVVCLWFAIYELAPGSRERVIGNEITTTMRPGIIEIYGHNLEVGVTRVVIILLAILEAVQLYMRIFSNWSLVRLICQYVRQPSTEKSPMLEKVIIFILMIQHFFSRERVLSFMFKPWKRTLGQYSLLQSYDHVPLRTYLSGLIGGFVKLPRKGQKESPAVAVSIQMKQAIVSMFAITDHGLTLSCGKTSLARNKWDELMVFCELDSDADVILVWHIATSVCKNSLQLLQPNDFEHICTATQLSNYCAYLLIFAPELMSSVPFNTLTTFDETIDYARKNFKGLNMDQLCTKLMGKNEENTVFGKAAELANKLRTRVLNDPNKGWKVLAEFWVELLLYLAPADTATAHAERLAKGGEFITLLWTLLTHAGIVSRDCFQSNTSF